MSEYFVERAPGRGYVDVAVRFHFPAVDYGDGPIVIDPNKFRHQLANLLFNQPPIDLESTGRSGWLVIERVDIGELRSTPETMKRRPNHQVISFWDFVGEPRSAVCQCCGHKVEVDPLFGSPIVPGSPEWEAAAAPLLMHEDVCVAGMDKRAEVERQSRAAESGAR